MKHLWILSAAAILIMAFSLTAVADNAGRIYGKITTVDDDVFEGLIRWDKNEGSWVDVLNGNKELSRRERSGRKKYGDRNRERSIELFGITIAKTGGSSWNFGNVAQSGMRFGHIQSLEVIDDDAARLVLKSGDEIELEGGSTDIGTGIREITIEDNDEGEIELVWDDIDRVEFMQGDGSIVSNQGERLYGSLTTRRGDTYTGFVCWDVDELFTRDILDGELKGRKRKIKFGKIKSIERYSSNGATVVLNNGDELLLRGTNDVDGSNSGIIISDLGFGQVIVKWDEFDRLDFHNEAAPLTYADFDGGRKLSGTVFTDDGESYTGLIRWDDDEEYTWEILDGDYRDIEFDIEFGLIKEIAKKSYRSAIVTVWDGRTFRLRGSNDVDEDNKGIFITTADGEEIELDWEEFERVEFSRN
ncbi:MAG: hypothetical protein OEV49_13000 [candidate division Zixibacteria bacterium]|nr:hypothetical protein [candidate division Zixibacteria bacterium]MDH3938290.1 hypothetical protein [candidate division Zixibacteria bacterium]MDH4035389.1 hypothetical protein [candidate division Zixibacteria bacterium]